MPSPVFDQTFANALYDIAIEEGNTLTLEAIRNKALEQISKGYSSYLISQSVNGKAFSFNVSKPADQLFAEASWAIKKFNQGVITTTTFDFTLLI